MKPEMAALLRDLASVLEKHKGGLTCTTDDDGVHVSIGDDWRDNICIKWPKNGDVSQIRNIIYNVNDKPTS